MRKARILYKDEEAGMLTQHDDGSYTFSYHDAWLTDHSKPAISLIMPKIERAFYSKFLFPFFYNMLPEGSNKQVVCKYNRLDPADDFGLLLTVAKNDSIGAVRVVKIE